MTASQFLQLDEDPPGARLELVDGEVTSGPSQSFRRSYVNTKLCYILSSYIDANDLGELYGDVGIIFGEYDVRRPDLLFFAKDRLHLIGEVAMEGPPDLCVEIISPSSGEIDRKQKFKQYQKGKVANYWIIDPDARTIEGYRLLKGKYVLAGSGMNDEKVSLPPFQSLVIEIGRLWRPQ